MTRILKEMIKEEWRLHSTLFGSKKFALFPVAVLLLSLLIHYTLPLLAITESSLQHGIHLLMVFLGLNVGAIGFVGRSGLKNLLGDTNLLIFSTRTLPVSKATILSTFIVKDLLYYYGLFILPLILGKLATGSITGFWIVHLSYLLAFLAGISITFLASVIIVRSRMLLLVAAAVIGGAMYHWGIGLSALNFPYMFYLTGSPVILGISLLLSLIFLGTGAAFFGFQPSEGNPTEITRGTYEWIASRIGALRTKNLLDLQRSAGGFGKIVFSYLILIGVYALLVSTLPVGSVFLNSPLLTLATLLGISSVTTYNWLNRFDALKRYQTLPIDRKQLLQSKIATFTIISAPLLIVSVVACFFVFGGTGYELLHSLLIALLTSSYILSITVRLTGLNPNEMILDVTVFTKFLLASAALLVPYMVAGIIYPVDPASATAALFILYIVTASISYVMITHKVR